MTTLQQNHYEESIKNSFIDSLKSFTCSQNVHFFRQLMLTDGAKFFFDRSKSLWIAQEIETFLPDLTKVDQTIFNIKLSFNEKGHAVLSVDGMNKVQEISLSDFPFQDETFEFYLYRNKLGFTLMLHSEY